METSFQRSINKMTRATLGAFPSTPVAFLQAEGGLAPAAARLERRQGAFARLALCSMAHTRKSPTAASR